MIWVQFNLLLTNLITIPGGYKTSNFVHISKLNKNLGEVILVLGTLKEKQSQGQHMPLYPYTPHMYP